RDPGEAHHLRVDHAERDPGRHARIHRIAARVEDLESGERRQRVARGHRVTEAEGVRAQRPARGRDSRRLSRSVDCHARRDDPIPEYPGTARAGSTGDRFALGPVVLTRPSASDTVRRVRPRIGVSASIMETQLPGGTRRTFLNEPYVQAVQDAGGLALVVTPAHGGPSLQALYELFDGLLLTGGEDVAPERYGEGVVHPTVLTVPDR